MASVKLEILRIVNESFPGFVECKLVDCGGKSHFFIDKLPVVADCSDVPPCDGAARCSVLKAKKNTFVIDTSIPDDIESTNGEYIFEVNKDQVII